MEIQLKHRIFGAIITVIGLAIALPVVLDKTRHMEVLQSEVPPMPDIPEWAQVENQEQIRQEAIELIDGSAAKRLAEYAPKVVDVDEPAVVGLAATEAGMDETQQPVAWALQLGAFKNHQNARQLAEELRRKGFKAFIDELPQDELVRVYVGPEIKRNRIEELQQQLRQELQQQDIHIKRWLPGK